MRSIKLLGVILILVISSCSSSTKQSETTAGAAFDTTFLKPGTEFYQCPMHPEVVSEKEGDCPKCGMALEKVVKV